MPRTGRLDHEKNWVLSAIVIVQFRELPDYEYANEMILFLVAAQYSLYSE